jgi:hypothetical protein
LPFDPHGEVRCGPAEHRAETPSRLVVAFLCRGCALWLWLSCVAVALSGCGFPVSRLRLFPGLEHPLWLRSLVVAFLCRGSREAETRAAQGDISAHGPVVSLQHRNRCERRSRFVLVDTKPISRRRQEGLFPVCRRPAGLPGLGDTSEGQDGAQAPGRPAGRVAKAFLLSPYDTWSCGRANLQPRIAR